MAQPRVCETCAANGRPDVPAAPTRHGRILNPAGLDVFARAGWSHARAYLCTACAGRYAIVETLTTLESLIAAGIVWVDDGEYVGRAADGIEVNLGCVGDEAGVARHLAANPTPETW